MVFYCVFTKEVKVFELRLNAFLSIRITIRNNLKYLLECVSFRSLFEILFKSMPHQCAAFLVRSLHTYTLHSDIIFCMVAFVFGRVSTPVRKVFNVVLLYAYGTKRSPEWFTWWTISTDGTTVDRFTMQIYANHDLIKRPPPLHASVVLEVSWLLLLLRDKLILFVVSSEECYNNTIIQGE